MRTWFALFAASIIAVAVSCGARSGLPLDAPAAQADAGPDAPPDVVVNSCADAGTSYIYLISSENALIRFNPPDLSFTTIGTIDCPSSGIAAPFSMAVDRQGVAYVLFSDGELFRVSTLTASCEFTSFVAQQGGFPLTFGMGFSSTPGGQDETLFVAGDDLDNPSAPSTLAILDTATFGLGPVGPLSSPITRLELTGTGDARLFGFSPTKPDSHLAEIDKATATVTSDVLLDLNQGDITSWAFAFWGGDFYFFTSEQPGLSVVHRYTPGGTTTPPAVAQIDLTIVGAGVSTCAPSE